MIDEHTLKKLEFDTVLKQISTFCYSDRGKEIVLDIKPETSFSSCVDLLDQTEAAYKIMNVYNVYPIFSCSDIGSLATAASKGISLTISELYNVLRFVKLTNKIYKDLTKIDDPSLESLIQRVRLMNGFSAIEERLTKILQSDTELNDDASPELLKIRNNIIRARSKVNAKLKSYVTEEKYRTYLQDSIIVVRENRYVIPVKVEYQERIKGIIHDRSNSGATVFIEPLEVLELNNELRMFELMEREEIQRILSVTSSFIGSFVADLVQTYDIIVYLDIVFAKGMYAIKSDGIRPVLNEKGYIDVKEARHPLIEKSCAVYNNISFGKNNKMLVISGPNAGGKTVTLKTVGLFELLSMSGIFVTARESAELSFFDKIYVDVGDEQSIENNLSTFSSHMKNIAYITDNADRSTLVLLDELGSGTEPADGSALAISVIKYLLNVGSKGVITTHYNNVKAFATTEESIENASMDYDGVNLRPTYKLLLGNAGTSNALNIAKQFGVRDDIIQDAKNYISEDSINYEKAIKVNEEKNRELIALTESLKKEKAEFEIRAAELEKKHSLIDERMDKINVQAKQLIKNKVSEYTDKAEEIIEEMKEIAKHSTSQNILKARTLKNNLEDEPEEEVDESLRYEFAEGSIKIGDWVYVEKLKDKAQVTDIKGVKVYLKLGAISTVAKYSDLKKVVYKPSFDEPAAPQKTAFKQKKIEAVSTELNIIGHNTEEGITALDKFIDYAYAHGLKEVRIIHGKGTYKLRNAVWEALKDNSLVSSFRQGRYGEGESGATVVTLK